MFRLRTPDARQLRALLQRRIHASLTYEELGATQDDELPGGYTHDRYRTGLGRDTFERAVAGLESWQAHRGAGVGVFPADAALVAGTDVMLTIGIGPLRALAPCRVVYVRREADEFGFAYGTLPGHPERGEEAFLVERDADGMASLSIVAFSRPAGLASRLGRPVARTIQRRTTDRYLGALRRYAGAG